MENWYFYKLVVARTGSAGSETRVLESCGKYRKSEVETKLLYLRARRLRRLASGLRPSLLKNY